jgi:rod shape-determining protein MreC
MESFFVRYRNYVVLLAMLVTQIVGLAVQVRRTDAGSTTLAAHDGPGVRLIRLWANALVSPPERLIHSSRLGLMSVWQSYFDLRHTRAENQELQKTIDRLRLEQAALLEDAKQGQRLEAMMGFQQKYLYATLAAQVFGSSGTDLSRVFYIDKGSADKLDRDMAVITPDGIVGKVREVFRHSAQVMAINDQTSGAGVILETTRIRGILRGNAAGQLQIVDLLADKRIQPGETVLTAGGDQIFPRGLPVGVVEQVVPDPDQDGFIKVIIKPAAHLDRLDEVLVITSTQPRFSPEQQTDLATSVTLKGAEAVALDEQRKASTIMAERLPGLIDPNLPPDQQPLRDTSLPSPVLHPPQPLRPDRFTPGNAVTPPPSVKPEADEDAKPAPAKANRQPSDGAAPVRKPAAAPAAEPAAPATPPGQETKPQDQETKPQGNS